MARFCGKVGFVQVAEQRPGIYLPGDPIERTYHGDAITRRVRLDNNRDSTNKDFVLSEEIRIVADKFAKENIGYMRYVVQHGFKWEIVSATFEYPRINLTLGGIYNG